MLFRSDTAKTARMQRYCTGHYISLITGSVILASPRTVGCQTKLCISATENVSRYASDYIDVLASANCLAVVEHFCSVHLETAAPRGLRARLGVELRRRFRERSRVLSSRARDCCCISNSPVTSNSLASEPLCVLRCQRFFLPAMSSDAVKRIMAEVRELAALEKSPDAFFTASPLESDLFEWHFTVRGPPETAFATGLYHGRIVLPPEYPLKAPEIILLTPNGRFEVGTRICLSVTSHHNETWQPSWGIRTILTALVGFMPSKSEGLGALDYSAEDRRALARKSLSFECPRCGASPVAQFPPDSKPVQPTDPAAAQTSNNEPSSVPLLGAEEGSSSTCNRESSSVGEGSRKTPAGPIQQQQVEPAVEDATIAAPTAPEEPLVLTATTPNTSRSSRSRSQQESPQQEKELLYLACAIAFAIFAIIARRVASTFS